MLVIPYIFILIVFMEDNRLEDIIGIIGSIFLTTGMVLGPILCNKVNKLGFFVLITLMIIIYIVPFIRLLI